MNRDEFENNWDHWKGKIRDRWDKFTYKEIVKMRGKFDYFIDQLQKKYGYTPEAAKREVNEWENPKIERLPLGGQQRLSDLESHRRLVHEDRDPIYPFQPPKGEEAQCPVRPSAEKKKGAGGQKKKKAS